MKKYDGLNLFQRLRALFGKDYVVLIHHDGEHMIKPVQWLGEMAFSAPYLQKTRGRLLANGGYDGRNYIRGWLPITERTKKLFE